MLDRLNSESVFLEHLGWIEKVAAIACAKGGVKGAEAEDFAGWIRLKLMEDDYATLRRFRGDAQMKTYLATVVARQFQEFRRERGGRWRPSAAALRLGPPARDLEALVYRDGYRLDQAGEKLRTAGRTTLSDAQLARLLARLPQRGPLRPVEVSPDLVLPTTEGAFRADELVLADETEALRGRVMAALGHAMDRLEPDDRMVARMHFVDGRTLAEVARTLKVEQKPLYRRVDRLRKQLRESLRAEGVTDDDVLDVLRDRSDP